MLVFCAPDRIGEEGIAHQIVHLMHIHGLLYPQFDVVHAVMHTYVAQLIEQMDEFRKVGGDHVAVIAETGPCNVHARDGLSFRTRGKTQKDLKIIPGEPFVPTVHSRMPAHRRAMPQPGFQPVRERSS